MGLLSKKEPIKRPFQDLGRDNRIRWYTDNNEIFVENSIYLDLEVWLVKNKKFIGIVREAKAKELDDSPRTHHYIPIKEFVWSLWEKQNDYFELFLVYADMPESVENFFIMEYKRLNSEFHKLNEKLSLKKKRINEVR